MFYSFGCIIAHSNIKIKAIALYIINFVEIAYHPSENEYISLSDEYIIITEF